MSDILAIVRPDEQNVWLFLHILGALFLVGALAAAAYYLFRSRRDGSPALARVGFRTLLFGAIPSFLLSRITAQLLLDEQNRTESEDAWITIGFLVTDVGVLLIVAATVASAVAMRRAEGTSSRGSAIAAWSCSILLVAYTVALWAMATKPV